MVMCYHQGLGIGHVHQALAPAPAPTSGTRTGSEEPAPLAEPEPEITSPGEEPAPRQDQEVANANHDLEDDADIEQPELGLQNGEDDDLGDWESEEGSTVSESDEELLAMDDLYG